MFPDALSKSISEIGFPNPARPRVSRLSSLLKASCIAVQARHNEWLQPDSSSSCIASGLGEDSFFGKRLASFKAFVSKTSICAFVLRSSSSAQQRNASRISGGNRSKKESRFPMLRDTYWCRVPVLMTG